MKLCPGISEVVRLICQVLGLFEEGVIPDSCGLRSQQGLRPSAAGFRQGLAFQDLVRLRRQPVRIMGAIG